MRRTVRRLESGVGTAWGAVAVFALAIAQYGLVSIALPVLPGRDFGDYLWFYVQMGDWRSVFPMSMLFRAPVAPALIGWPLDVAGGWGALAVMALLFAGSIVAWTRVALIFGRRAALLTAVALLAFPGYTILFHQLSSNAVFAATFAGFALALTRALTLPSPGRFAALGLTIAVAALTRPESQVLVVFAVVPLALALPRRRRLTSASACGAVALLVLGGWALNNGLRYHDYTVARRGTAYLPFFRAFTTDHIVSPRNGSASRELARAVEADLLTQQPYRAYGVTSEAFFARGKDREFADLLSLSDRGSGGSMGWDSNYGVLVRAGIEAVRAHPETYARGVGHTLFFELWHPLFVALPTTPTAASDAGASNPTQLPKPSEGDLVPTAHEGAYLATPDGHIREVWTSATEHHLVFAKPSQQTRYNAVQAAASRLGAKVPPYAGNETLTRQLSRSSKLFPPALLWLVVGLAGILIRRPARASTAVAVVVSALLVVVFDAFSDYAIIEFAVPVVPALIVFGAAGLVGARRMADRGLR